MPAVFDLQRFIDAQDPVYRSVLDELRAGEKRGHWMWYIFPQIQGLGGSPMSREYAIASRDEARAYAEHPILGARLRECTELVMALEDRTLEALFPYPDNLKFHSCVTLFDRSATDPGVFRAALLTNFDGRPDQRTLDILDRRRE